MRVSSKKLLSLLVVMGVAVNVQASDLLGSVKKANDKVEKTQTQAKETKTQAKETKDSLKDAASSPEQAALALVKAKYKTGSTKQKVREDLGKPASTKSKDGLEIWSYDVNKINSKLGDAAQVADTVGVKVPGADKTVDIQFKSDMVHAIVLSGEETK